MTIEIVSELCDNSLTPVATVGYHIYPLLVNVVKTGSVFE